MKLFQRETYKRGIVLSSLFSVFAKALNFLQTIAIAFFFGTINSQVDIYFYCFGIISLLFTSISLLNYTIIVPEAIRLRAREGEKQSMYFLNKWLYIYLGIGIIFAVVVAFYPVHTYTLISKFNTELLEKNTLIIYLTIPLFLLMVINQFFVSILTLYKFFTMPQLVRIINNSFALIFLILFHKILSVNSILIGLLLGFLINLVILVRMLIKQCNWSFTYHAYKLPIRIIRDGILSFLGHSSKIFSNFFGNYLLSGLGLGVIAAMNFGNRVAGIANEVVTLQTGPVVGIKLGELFAQKNYDGINKLFIRTTSFLNFVLIPISTLFFIFSDEIIAVLFQRGAFDSGSTLMVSSYMRQFGISLSLVSINLMVSEVFQKAQKMKKYFWYLITKNSLLTLLIYLGVKRFGGIGFPAAINTSDFLNLFYCFIIMNLYFPYIEYKKIILKFFSLLTINVLIGFGIYLFSKFIQFPHVLVKLIACCGLYGIILLTLTYLLNLNRDVIEALEKIKSNLLIKLGLK